MIFLHKLIPLLVSPLALVLILMIVGMITRSRLLAFSAILLLLFTSSPLIARYSLYVLEKDNPPTEISNLPNADALVVLSGMMKAIEMSDGSFDYEFGDAVDRFFAAIDAVQQKKVKRLIFTRGQLPWSQGLPEGEVLKRRAVALGVPEEMIQLTPPVENTQDEAKAVSAMLLPDTKRIVLVTSAFHMPRAASLFEAQGFDVVRMPVDFKQSADRITPMDVLPSAAALEQITFFEREMLGRLFYALKGAPTQ